MSQDEAGARAAAWQGCGLVDLGRIGRGGIGPATCAAPGPPLDLALRGLSCYMICNPLRYGGLGGNPWHPCTLHPAPCGVSIDGGGRMACMGYTPPQGKMRTLVNALSECRALMGHI